MQAGKKYRGQQAEAARFWTGLSAEAAGLPATAAEDVFRFRKVRSSSTNTEPVAAARMCSVSARRASVNAE